MHTVICGSYEERGLDNHVVTKLKGVINLVIEWNVLSNVLKINTVLNALSL